MLNQLTEEFDPKEFAVIGLSVDRSPSSVVKFIKMKKVNYTILMADRGIVNGFGGVAGVPTTFIVDKNGNVLRRFPGFIPHKALRNQVEEALAR